MQKQGQFVKYTISADEWNKLVVSKTGASIIATKSVCSFDQDTFISEVSSAPVNLRVDISLVAKSKSTAFSKFNFVE
jgi:hypothetical protein